MSSSSIPVSSSVAISSSSISYPNCEANCVDGQVYTTGKKCAHNNRNWTAKWWINTLPPGEAWTDNDLCEAPLSSSSGSSSSVVLPDCASEKCMIGKSYPKGEQCVLNGVEWEAKWQIGTLPPGTGGWKEVGDCIETITYDEPTTPCLDGQIYRAGDACSHQGRNWKAKWYTTQLPSETNQAWEETGWCR